ncbi:MAG: leucine-rich repeat domain-containing protein, partial [Clostridiales bacterium]|nr:leucine-rich repeat domain-containing protein [Clostridiales bacterium]
QGQYVMRDHGYNVIRTDCIMALDGFGYATYIEVVGDGSMLHVSASGEYEWDEKYNDYKFTFNRETDADDAKAQVTHFTVTKEEIKDSEGKPTEFKGSFRAIGLLGTLGMESAAFMQYADGELLYSRIDLNGYGDAEYYVYDVTTQKWNKIDEGTYKGTDNYDSYLGEWQYIPGDDSEVEAFSFILSTLRTSSGLLNIFVVFDENKYGRFTSDDGSTLYLDGYGEAEYIYNSVAYYGECTIKDGVVTLIQQAEDEDGNIVAGNRFVFTISGNKFEISKDGCIINDSGVLTFYDGTSAVVSIPEKATKIAANAFNYSNTSVSLISVTIPATVTEIGKYAFRNNYTLRRAEFLSATPIAIDFSAENDPFRWGAGDFVIVVPEDAVDVYKAACEEGGVWEGCQYTIMGSEEVLAQPTFKVINGVLVRYNKPDGSADLIDLVIPENVTEIADGVFLGADYLKSVDLNNTVKIGEMAFYGCVNLEKVVFTKVEELGSMAFAACTKLNNSGTKDELVLPSIKTVGGSAFSGCESLRLVQLGASLEQIGDFAFYLCNVYVTDPQVELVVELLGDTAPVMGEKIVLGNVLFRFKVQNIKVAIKCYKEKTWNAYCRHLYIESGAEKGTYISGDDTLVLDGRAVYQSSYVWMYAIDGNKIRFYEYDSTESTYTTIVGTYENDEISFVLGNSTRHFVRIKEEMTYKTKDGKYTLVCDPMQLQPESYENNKGTAKVKFNGKEVDLEVNGYNTKIIYKFEDADGKLYDIYITFSGETMEVTKKLSPIKYELTAADDSKITILFQNDFIYILTAEFVKIEVDAGRNLYWTEASGMGVLAEQKGNTYTFSFRFRSDIYNFTVTVSADNKTFTYTHEKA